jgi:uncharacterized protein (TIGR02646 family)
MIRIRRRPLPSEAQSLLDRYQADVGRQAAYENRVKEAKRLFGQRNKQRNPAFREVRAALTEMCHGARRCMYCEDAPADEVEHFRPKDLYPELVFAWSNYLYACGICNGPKNNRWGLLGARGPAVTEGARRRGFPVVPPPPGHPALIDPSLEDPLKYLFLDLQTFVIVPLPGNSARKSARASYTIKILDLNKDLLIASRQTVFEAYFSHLNRAYSLKREGQPVPSHLRDAVRWTYHPTVWAEMKRQQAYYSHLQSLFSAVPEALDW